MLKNLQNNPFVFWFLAAITVGSAVFAVYTFEITKPSRDLVFRIYSQNFTVPDGMGGAISISTPSGDQHPANGYIKQLDVWNYGNLEIEPTYTLEPIRVVLGEKEFFIDLIERNVAGGNFRYELENQIIKIKFDKILPKAGFTIRYYSTNNSLEPQIDGLIADPIRGALPIKNASITDLGSQSSKAEKWYWEVLSAFLLPITFSSTLLSMVDIKPISKKGKLIKNTIFYVLLIATISLLFVKFYNFVFSRPPF